MFIQQINHNKINFHSQDKIYQQKPQYIDKSPKFDTFEMSIGYINDLHGQTNNMLRTLTGLKGDLRLSGGDNHIGDEKNKNVNKVVVKFMNLAGIKGSALGNHELDTRQKDFEDTVKDFNGNYFASNLVQEPLEEQDLNEVEEMEHTQLNSFIKKSSIINIKGENIGLIGATALDLTSRVTHPSYHKDCSTDILEYSIDDIQDEINDLKEKGINKIILLSHMGYEVDKIVAQNTEGIDVIVGGHTHELVKDIKEGENLQYSLAGEPVVITQAGKNGNYFGLLNLEFDKEGVLTKVQNNLGETKNFAKNMIYQYIFDETLGKPEEVGYIKEVAPQPKSLVEENPHANFMCDAMRYELDVDIAMWNNSGTRSYFQPGIINNRDIKDIAPFEDRVSVARVTEDALVDMFKEAIKDTYNTPGFKPGLIAVSGLKYTVKPDEGKLAGMSFVDKNNVEHKIDVNNPSKSRIYTVAQDSFMMFDGADYIPLAKKEDCINYPFNKDYLACQYIKHLNEPIVINQTGRIMFE